MALFKQIKIIDIHAHTFFQYPSFLDLARENGADFTFEGLHKACIQNNITQVCAIYNDLKGKTPIGAKELAQQQKKWRAIIGVGIVNPNNTKADSLKATEKAIANGTFKALKVYPGVHNLYCSDKKYHAYYKLAAKYDIPVYVHSGDTMARGSRLKFTRPLDVDDIAVSFPETNFLITQMGNPWLTDAAEVAYKNDNVYLDTAGLFSGMRFSKLYNDRLQYVIDYIDNPKKILYGSDWPKVRIKEYIDFIKSVFPKRMHEKLFYANARKLFKL